MDSQIVYWIKITISAGVIIGAIGYLVLYVVEQRDKKVEEKKTALNGTIPSKIIPGRNTVTVLFGQSMVSVDINSLRLGSTLNPLSFFGGSNITIRLEDEMILLSAQFRSLDGKLVAQIIDNEWQVNPNNYFERNYDDNALEVIDQDGITKFQIDFTDIYNIRLGGSFIAGNSLYTFHKSGRTTIIGISVGRDELVRASDQIETMFLYPSDKYFGKRRNHK